MRIFSIERQLLLNLKRSIPLTGNHGQKNCMHTRSQYSLSSVKPIYPTSSLINGTIPNSIILKIYLAHWRFTITIHPIDNAFLL
jgi:hypothetical protein